MRKLELVELLLHEKGIKGIMLIDFAWVTAYHWNNMQMRMSKELKS